MNIACPYCKAGLTPKKLKPGKYQPKCPKCARPFLIVVPADETGTISVQPVEVGGATSVAPSASVPPKPAAPEATAVSPAPKPVARKQPGGQEEIPVSPSLAESLGTDPNATGDFTEPEPSPKKTSVAVPPAKSRKADPNATGDFTEHAEPRPTSKPFAGPSPGPAPSSLDPSASRDFTEGPDPSLPATVVSKRASAKVGPNATGHFAEPRNHPNRPGHFTEPAAVGEGERTGDFTEAPSTPQATAMSPADVDDDDFSVGQPSRTQVASGRRAARESEDDDTPVRLGGYEVLKVLGKGGMGAVLLGRQVSLDRKVALKVMHPKIAKNPSFVARFTREAYAAAQLTHHNVIQIYDIGEDGGKYFFSMEFVPGQSLMEVVKKNGKLSPEAAVGYLLQAARGLRYGHHQGMVHRDIKPDNLMLNTEGIVKVADLGLVKLPGGELSPQAGSPPSGIDGPSGSSLTHVGAVMGTPAYMPPEQARDSGSVDQRADIYSLGCTLYVLVTGRPPFEGKTAMEVISKHQTEPITPPEVVVKRVPKALSAILLKMMAKRPEDRYQTMDEVIGVLEEFLGVDRAGPLNPTEEQADRLERCAGQYNARSKGKLKAMLAVAFFAACTVGAVGAALAGLAALAGGLVGLMAMTPVAYFVAQGVLTGSVVFTRARALVFGMRFFDWVMWAGGGLLFLVTLYLFGLLWAWLGFAVVAAALGFVVWFLTDRVQASAQKESVDDARVLFKAMRLQGIEEEALRQFVCKFSGANWEPFYEALFGYEAKLAARAYRKGNTGEESRKAGTWREPLIGWIDARLEARRQAKQRKHLQKVEAKALEAEGVSRAEARTQAAVMAVTLVDQAKETKQAREEGREASIKAMVEAARERRRPKPGYTIAGKRHRSLWLKDFLNDWFGRRLRFGLGAVVFAAGLLWMSQNNLLSKDNNVFKQLVALNFDAAAKGLDAAVGKPLRVSFLPPEVTQLVNSYAVPITGLLLMLSGMLHFGWRPSLVAIPGAAVGTLGPMFGVPEVGPLSPQMLSLIAGAVLIVVVARFLRE